MSSSIDGFYAVYMSGKQGQGLAMLIFNKGSIMGADAGGVMFDGQYVESAAGTISVRLSTKAPPNLLVIQGGTTGSEVEVNQLDFEVSQNFTSEKFIRVETHRGPVNARFVKVRELDN